MGLGCHGATLNMRPRARHFTCMCTLSNQQKMARWLEGDCLCVSIVSSAAMTSCRVVGLYAPEGDGLLLERKDSTARETCENNYYLAIGCRAVLVPPTIN